MTKEERDIEAKRNVFLKVCEQYSNGEALNIVMKSYSLTPMLLADWLRDPEWRSIFEKSSEAFLLFQDLNIKTKALLAFEKLVEGYTVKEISVETTGEGEKLKVIKTITKDKHFAPNAQAVLIALQKLIPNVYSDPSKLLPPPQDQEAEQVYRLGNGQIIKF